MKRPSSLDRHQSQLETELRSVVGDEKSPLRDMIRFQLGWIDHMRMPAAHGWPDRLHGTVCLLASAATGGDLETALPAAAAAELAYASMAIHEDLRQGITGEVEQPTLWWSWGSSQGINAGDGAYSMARLAVFRLEERGVPAARVVQTAMALDQACLAYTEAQYRVIEREGETSPDPDSYVKLVEGKAGELFGMAATLGVRATGGSEDAVRALQTYGRKVGCAWLLAREVETIWETGATATASLIECIDKGISLPVLYAWAHGSPEDVAHLESVRRREHVLDDAMMATTLEVIGRTGAQAYAEDTVRRMVGEAKAALVEAKLGESSMRELEGLADYLANVGG